MLEKFVNHKTLANLLMVVFIGIGIYALPSLKKETFPDFTSSEIDVTVTYPGASALEVEESICQKIEDAIDGIRFVKEVRSVANENVGKVTIELFDGADITEIQSEVESEVNAIDDFPDNANDPVVTQLGLTNDVMTLAVTSKKGSEQPISAADLKDYCEDLKVRLRSETKASLVEVHGFSDRQYRVDLDHEKLRSLNISASQVASAISKQSVDAPAGMIETQDDILIRFVEKRRSIREIEQIVVTGFEGGAEIQVKDIGKVVDTFEDPEVQSWYDGQRAGIIKVKKTKLQDTTNIASAVKEFLKKERVRHPQLEIAVTSDDSVLIMDRLKLLLKNTWQGIVLVFLTMWLFFNIRISFWVVMSLPVSFLGAFFFMPMMGQSINMMTMVAMLLAVGLLMDDGIVIAENIASHRAMGKKPMRSAIDGVSEVAGGVLSSFFTTICVLAPLATLSGMIGKVLQVIPIVLLTVMAVSLVEAFLILPAHLGHSLHDDPNKAGPIRSRINGAVDWTREKFFGSIIDWSISWRYLVTGTCVAVFILSLSLMASGIVGFKAFPDTEGDRIQARILLPQGTPLRTTESVATATSEAAYELNKTFADQPGGEELVRSVLVEFNSNRDSFETGPHVATVTAQLLQPESRNTKVDDMLAAWRSSSIGKIPDVLNITFGEPSFGPAGRPIEIYFKCDSLVEAEKAADDAREWFAKFKGVFDLDDDLRKGKREIRISLKEGAVGLGLDAQAMANQLGTAFQGTKADDLQIGVEQFEVIVQLGRDYRNSIDDLSKFHFVLADGNQVPIDSVAETVISDGFSRIARIDGKRTVTLIGNTDSSIVNTSQLIRQFQKNLLPELMEKYPSVRIEMGGESAESADTQSSMLLAFGLGLFGVYVILCFQFESWLEPLIVMIAIPMALIGTINGHLLFQMDISMPSMIGFISLAGVVVNDSILLILFLKEKRKEGEEVEASARMASRLRFRAILLTSATTVAGLLPLAFEQSTQAQTLVPLAIAIAFGMMASTVLILIVIPCIYVILCDLRLISQQEEEHE